MPWAACAALVRRQPGEMPAAPSELAPRGPAGESLLVAGEAGFPSQALPVLGTGALEGSSSSLLPPVAAPVALSPHHVPPTVIPGVPGQHCSWSGDPEGAEHPLTTQRLLHDEVHGAGVCVWLGQCPALIHCCPGSLTTATCTGREGHSWGRCAQGPHYPGTTVGTVPCTLCVSSPKCLPDGQRELFGSAGSGWADLPAGRACAPRLPPHIPAGLADLRRDKGGDPRRTFHPSTVLSRAAGAPGAGRMGTHHASSCCMPLLWGGDTHRRCLGLPARHSRTRGAVCACVYRRACALQRDGEEAVGRL